MLKEPETIATGSMSGRLCFSLLVGKVPFEKSAYLRGAKRNKEHCPPHTPMHGLLMSDTNPNRNQKMKNRIVFFTGGHHFLLLYSKTLIHGKGIFKFLFWNVSSIYKSSGIHHSVSGPGFSTETETETRMNGFLNAYFMCFNQLHSFFFGVLQLSHLWLCPRDTLLSVLGNFLVSCGGECEGVCLRASARAN